MITEILVHKQKANLTPKSDQTPVHARVDDAKRLREIRALVTQNNRSQISDDVIVCQIYMESRFDANARPGSGSARGLMQLLKVAVRELYRVANSKLPKSERRSESEVFADADRFHESAEFINEATNIRVGTSYMQILVDRETARGASDPIVEAYKDYRGVRNGVYYAKIKAAADKLVKDPENMGILREMVK